MERLSYISLVTELRQIAVARAMSLLGDIDDAEDVAGEVLLKLWERHKDLRNNADEVRHLADRTSRNLALNQLQHRQRHPILRIFHRQDSDEEENCNIPDIPDWSTPQQYIEDILLSVAALFTYCP